MLLEVARLLDAGERGIRTDEVVDAVGLSETEVAAAFEALIDVHLTGGHTPPRAGHVSHVITGMTERGRREVGIWPSEQTALERMIEQLQAIADNTDADDDTRSRARKALDSFTGAGRDIAISVASAIVTGQVAGS